MHPLGGVVGRPLDAQPLGIAGWGSYKPADNPAPPFRMRIACAGRLEIPGCNDLAGGIFVVLRGTIFVGLGAKMVSVCQATERSKPMPSELFQEGFQNLISDNRLSIAMVFGILDTCMVFVPSGAAEEARVILIHPPENGFFSKRTSCEGIPIKAHRDVSDAALAATAGPAASKTAVSRD